MLKQSIGAVISLIAIAIREKLLYKGVIWRVYIFLRDNRLLPGKLLKKLQAHSRDNRYRVKPNDKYWVKKDWRKRFGRPLNLTNPRTFNEKIQWLKLCYRNPLMPLYADKYRVRVIVEERIGAHILTKLYGVYEDVESIDPSLLPGSFVLKLNNGSGWNSIVKDKSNLDWATTAEILREWMSTNYYELHQEWAYRDIPPRIICERYLEDSHGLLRDWKLFCFNGTPKFVQIDVDRFTNHRRVLYDIDWHKVDCSIKYPLYEGEIPRPDTLDKMLEIARTLSSEFPFARVDLYDVDGSIFFGEVTFYPGNGLEIFSPESWDRRFGDLLRLPTRSR